MRKQNKRECIKTQFLEASTFIFISLPLLAYFCLQEMIFLLIYLLLLLILLTFAAVKQLAMTYPANTAQQRNFDFFAFFSALYLVVSDILLTHTHTHTGAPSV